MKTIAAILLSALVVGGAWTFSKSQQGPFALKRSMPGHIVRWLCGKGGAAQDVDDLADELSRPATMAALHHWADSVLQAQRERRVPMDELRSREPLLRFVEAPEIAAPAVLAQHQAVLGVCTPVTFLHVDDMGRVDAAMLSWANLRLGLVVMPGQRAPTLKDGSYGRWPAQDTYVFYLES
jgi:hypothetical protein